MEKLTCVLLLIILLIPVRTNASELEEAINLYFEKRYAESIDRLEGLLNTPALNRDEMLKAKSYLGAASYLSGRHARASIWFLSILKESPDFELSPVFFPPELCEFFDELRQNAVPLVFERHEKYFVLNFLPFGAGQFQNRQYVKGTIFAGMEVTALAVNLSSYFMRKSMETDSGYSTEDLPSARRLQNIQIAAGAVFIATYIYGIIDGVWSYKTEKKVLASFNPEKNAIVFLYDF